MLARDRLPIVNALPLGPVNEAVQQRGISFLRLFRLPFFVADVLQKIFYRRIHNSVPVSLW